MSIFKKTLFLAPIQLISWMFVQWIVLEKLFNYDLPYDILLYYSFFIYIIIFVVIYLLGSFLWEMCSIKNVIAEKILFKPKILLLYSIAIFICSFFVFVAGNEWTWGFFFFYFVSPFFLFFLVSSYMVTCILLFLGISGGKFLAKILKK